MPVASCTETNKDPKTAERPSERDRTDQSAGFPVVAADCIGRALLRYLASRFLALRLRSFTNSPESAGCPPPCSSTRSYALQVNLFRTSLSIPLSFSFCVLSLSLTLVFLPPHSTVSLLASIYTFTVIRARESFAQSVLISRLFDYQSSFKVANLFYHEWKRFKRWDR